MFYARIFEKFGKMTRVISHIVVELLIFWLYFAFWTILFSFLSMVSGQNLNEKDYPDNLVWIAY